MINKAVFNSHIFYSIRDRESGYYSPCTQVVFWFDEEGQPDYCETSTLTYKLDETSPIKRYEVISSQWKYVDWEEGKKMVYDNPDYADILKFQIAELDEKAYSLRKKLQEWNQTPQSH